MNKFYYTYVLASIDYQMLYIGYSENVQKRLASHNAKENTATKPYAPYELVFYEAFLNKRDALNREVYLKSGWGRRSLNKMLKVYLANNRTDLIALDYQVIAR